MKRIGWLIALVSSLAVVLLVSCPSPDEALKAFVYVTNLTSDDVSAYADRSCGRGADAS